MGGTKVANAGILGTPFATHSALQLARIKRFNSGKSSRTAGLICARDLKIVAVKLQRESKPGTSMNWCLAPAKTAMTVTHNVNKARELKQDSIPGELKPYVAGKEELKHQSSPEIGNLVGASVQRIKSGLYSSGLLYSLFLTFSTWGVKWHIIDQAKWNNGFGKWCWCQAEWSSSSACILFWKVGKSQRGALAEPHMFPRLSLG